MLSQDWSYFTLALLTLSRPHIFTCRFVFPEPCCCCACRNALTTRIWGGRWVEKREKRDKHEKVCMDPGWCSKYKMFQVKQICKSWENKSALAACDLCISKHSHSDKGGTDNRMKRNRNMLAWKIKDCQLGRWWEMVLICCSQLSMLIYHLSIPRLKSNDR